MTRGGAKKILTNYILHGLDTEKYPLVYEAIMTAMQDMEKMDKILAITKTEDEA